MQEKKSILKKISAVWNNETKYYNMYIMLVREIITYSVTDVVNFSLSELWIWVDVRVVKWGSTLHIT